MNITLKHSKYAQGPAVVKFPRYAAGGTAIRLLDGVTGEPIATASVYLDGEPLDDGEIALKGWSENEGIPQDLVDAGIVAPAHRHVPTGFVTASIHKLLRTS